ncbi:anthranilate phosphoribosyltransferase [Emcibacter sp. SYSU 3D8]|uniref:anthranilate phosphoribosyltransferase n=1 Tax=Emcibacter sp. SYSU 3D8 TaxID=3133969 RepID=UPI0031FE4D27
MAGIKPFIAKVATRASLTEDEAYTVFSAMMDGDVTPGQMGGFLMALRVRGETVAEITGGARVMREKAVRVTAPDDAIDTCGTGGDGSGSYNISTAVALVVAALGVPVAKHGNRALSSRSGSAEVLHQLGVNIDREPDVLERCLSGAGIAFLMAPKHHTAMRHVGPVRVELGTRTIFNLLGPLSNPAGASRQLLGVFDSRWVLPMAQVLRNLGSTRVWVVHGEDGLDEITTTAATRVAELRDGQIREFSITPEDAGLDYASPEDLKGGDPACNAAALSALLDGDKGAYRDIVTLNAAAALLVADKVADLRAGVAMAAAALDSGAAKATLGKLVTISNSP